jgi:phage major head subunit gpT-like protein
MAISEQWAQVLEPGLREAFYLTADALAAASRIPLLYAVETSQKAQEHFLAAGAMGNWRQFKGAIEYDDIDQGYKTTLTHEEYVQGFKIERKLVEDDQYGLFQDRPQELAMSAMRTRETHAASVFVNAFTDAYAGGDGVGLVSDAHPASPANAASTQDNEGTLALTYANVEAVRQLMRAWKDDRGNLIPVSPDTLLVPAELEKTAFEIVRTANVPDTTDYKANFVAGFIRQVVVWDYLSDANAWFVIDSMRMKQSLKWLDRVPLEFALDPTSNFRLESRWRGYMRYSYGWKDWRWIYGNNPS